MDSSHRDCYLQQRVSSMPHWFRNAAPRRSTPLVFAAIFITGLLIISRLRMFAADDSFIHRRIAEHLLHTGHAYFNDNERVMVTSSPAWTVALALLSATRYASDCILVFEGLCLAAASTLAMRLALSATEEQPAWIRALIATIATLLTFMILLQSGVQQMETPLALALLLAGLWLLDRQNDAWLAVLLAAANTRYEIYLLVPVAVLFVWLRRRLTRRAILWAAAVWLISSAWLLWQYGTLLPHTVKAKSIAYSLTMQSVFHALGLSQLAVLALGVLCVAMMLQWRTLRIPPVLLFLFGLEVCAAYTLRKAFVFPWYIPLWRLPLLLGILLGPVLSARWWARIVAIWFFCLFTFRSAPAPREEIAAAVTGQVGRDAGDEFDRRVMDYLVVGQAIEHVCPGARLMSSEIGGLGYGFRGEVLDAFGLATPAALRWHPMKVPEQRSSGAVGAIPSGFFAEEHPDVVVTYPLFSEDLMRHYDRTAYALLTYPSVRVALAAREGRSIPEYWASIIVLVNRSGACPVQQLDAAIRAGLAAAAQNGKLPPAKVFEDVSKPGTRNAADQTR